MTLDEHTPDRELLVAWQHGDALAAERLIGRYGPRLHNFFASKVASGVEDLLQQTLSDCVAARWHIEEDGDRNSFRGFLFTVARRRLLNHYRQWMRRGHRLEPLEHSIADVEPSVSELVAARDRQRRLQWALQQLPIDSQVALELHYWEGLSVAEIAQVVDAPTGTVKARLVRARNRLKALLGPDPETTVAPEASQALGC
jgi:RNA polymerase sigma factor (sigma-70 family)